MRIISGQLKGRRYTAPKGFKSRPTTDQAKESLFNILNNLWDWGDIKALDLFSGTGGISYELCSRGCERVLSVEKNRRYARFIEAQAEAFGCDVIEVLNTDVLAFLELQSEQFDLIFSDPPFDSKDFERIPELVFIGRLLTEGGVLVVEHPPQISFASHPNFTELRKYGHVQFSFFRYLEE